MKKITAILGLLLGLFMVVGCARKPAKSFSEQLHYMMAHEEELSEAVRSYNEDEIHTVQFDWDTADVHLKANGLPQGDGYVFTLKGTFNNSKDTWFSIVIPIDNDGDPNIDRMYFIWQPKKNGKALPEKNGETLPNGSFSRELQYLKDSEGFLVKFVRSYNEDEIRSVKFDWDNAEMRNIRGRTEEDSGKAILLDGTFNDSGKNRFEIRIWLDDHGTPDVTRIEFLSEPSKGEKTLPEKPSE